MKFDWDPEKAKSNLTKHGISFEEAQEAFDDADKIEFYQQATGEDRWKMLRKPRNTFSSSSTATMAT